MNIPLTMNPDLLIETRDELDAIIKRFQKVNEIGEDKKRRIEELVDKDTASKIMDILFEEVIAE